MDNISNNLPEQPIGSPDSLTINADMKNSLSEAAKWGKFLGILGFILVGLMVAFAFGAGFFMNRFSANQTPVNGFTSTAGSIFMSVYMLLIALLYYFPSMYLYQFATKTKLALLHNESVNLSLAFSKLKSFFKFWGILAIIGFAFYAIGIIAFFIFYASKGAGNNG